MKKKIAIYLLSFPLVVYCINKLFSIFCIFLKINKKKFLVNTISENIDVVYTWVDANDPNWLKNKNQALGNDIDLLNESANKARYRNIGELKYSLRSLLQYANWVRNIYIVTDNQIPDFLSIDDERIKIIFHKEIFLDEKCLPVFNSHAIEANLHRIKGLSENFIYMNDDFFFRSAVQPSDFFSDDLSKTKFFLSNRAYIPEVIDKNSFPVDVAASNNSKLLAERYDYHTNRKFQHTPIALKKSIIEKFEKENPDVFEITSASRFRGENDYSILSSLMHFYGHHIGTAEPSSIPYFYISLDDKFFELKMNYLLLKKFKCFCINDVELQNNSEEIFDVFINKMNSLYPIPSNYEK